MNMIFEITKSKWTKLGLDPHDLSMIKDNGYTVSWSSSELFMIDSQTDEKWGKVTIKNGKIVKADPVFKAKFEELTGHGFKPAYVPSEKMEGQVFDGTVTGTITKTITGTKVAPPEEAGEKVKIEFHDGGVLNPKGAYVGEGGGETVVPDTDKPKGTLWVKPEKATKLKSSPDEDTDRLRDAVAAGEIIKGTNSNYTVYLISDDCNLAYKRTNTGLSVRAEGCTPEAEIALKAWGFDIKEPGKDGYSSVHLAVNGIDTALRTMGSITACVLTGMPTDLMRKKDFVS